MRKPGWYWVKFGNGNDWECKRLVPSGYWASHDGVMETEPSEVGPRIPTPDETWQCVPVEPPSELMRLMPEVLASLKGSGVDVSLADDVERALAASPTPE